MNSNACRWYIRLISGFATAWRLIVGPYRSNELLSDHQLNILARVSVRVKGGMRGGRKRKEGCGAAAPRDLGSHFGCCANAVFGRSLADRMASLNSLNVREISSKMWCSMSTRPMDAPVEYQLALGLVGSFNKHRLYINQATLYSE
jgi:hypothetical protein